MTVTVKKKNYPAWWLTSAVVGLTLGLSAFPLHQFWQDWQRSRQITFIPWQSFSAPLPSFVLQALPSDLLLLPSEETEFASFEGGYSRVEFGEVTPSDTEAVCPRPISLAALTGANPADALSLIDPLAPSLAQPVLAQRLPIPSPEIHERARLSRVHVMMYHDVPEMRCPSAPLC